MTRWRPEGVGNPTLQEAPLGITAQQPGFGTVCKTECRIKDKGLPLGEDCQHILWRYGSPYSGPQLPANLMAFDFEVAYLVHESVRPERLAFDFECRQWSPPALQNLDEQRAHKASVGRRVTKAAST